MDVSMEAKAMSQGTGQPLEAREGRNRSAELPEALQLSDCSPIRPTVDLSLPELYENNHTVLSL